MSSISALQVGRSLLLRVFHRAVYFLCSTSVLVPVIGRTDLVSRVTNKNLLGFHPLQELMASGATECVQLRRNDTSQPWGFRLQGGREFGLPLFIVQVNPKSIAGKAGLHNGDAVIQICGTPVTGYTHQEAKNELMRAGNEVDLYVVRSAVDITDPAVKARCGVGQSNKRVELDEGSINPHMNEGSMFRNVTPKTYKILEQQLGSSEPPASTLSQQPAQQMAPVHAQSAQPKPSSIFDRKKQERSDYLVAQGQTIQKTYGEQ